MQEKLPALFLGHGSPMNVLLDNSFTQTIQQLGAQLPRPKAIMVISAHWQTTGTRVTCSNEPEQIYDFYGFPPELNAIMYRPIGAQPYAAMVTNGFNNSEVKCDSKWGLDHAAWAILKHMYPLADIPVFEMSLNRLGDAQYHYAMGQKLTFLRENGVLIIGSGNIVHNLGLMDYDLNAPAFAWAEDFDRYVAQALIRREHAKLITYHNAGPAAQLAVPTNEHFLPLLYVAGLQQPTDQIKFVYEGFQYGSMSMRCLRIG
ncbi:MAG: 4,5-DOPA dioxygenase extradiol [Peptococcaceae bacterium]|nr:4,5-DOPA dioxygenase extradiol [Peptococcaceae bacterium]